MLFKTMNRVQKAEIDKRIGENPTKGFVTRSKNRGSELQSLSLRGGSRAVLVTADGRVTPAGERWFRAFPDDRPPPGGMQEHAGGRAALAGTYCMSD